MKIVQTMASPEEHALLVARARQARQNLKDLLKPILRSYLLSEDVKTDDPFFDLKFKGWNGERGSVERNAALYGAGAQNWSS